MTENDVINRIDIFRLQCGKTKAEMSREIGTDAGTFGNILNGKRGISSLLLITFLETYPQISAEWLLRGNPPMFIPSNPDENCTPPLLNKKKVSEKTLQRLINQLEKQELRLMNLISLIETTFKK